MNRLPIRLLFAGLGAAFSLAAQQQIAVTQFWNVNVHYNPAVTGLEYRHAANALYRNQWDQVNGAPNTVLLNYSARIAKIHGGAGISYSYDMIGFNRQHDIMGNYAFHLPVGEQNILSFGISGGAINLGVKPNWIPPTHTDDPLLPGVSNKTVFTMNAGIAFHAPKWNAGFSSTYLNAPTFRSGNGISYTAARHYYLFGDYTFTLTGDVLLKTQAQAYTDAIKYGGTVSAMFLYKNLWGGLNYSVENSAGVMLGYDFKSKYRIGYGYDMTINQLSSVSNGTHEIVLAYLLK